MPWYFMWKKVGETETEVEYHYGETNSKKMMDAQAEGRQPELSGRLVIDKSDPTGPLKEDAHGWARKARGEVNALRATTGQWPEGGLQLDEEE